MGRFEVSQNSKLLGRYERFNMAIDACNEISANSSNSYMTVFDYEAQPGMNCRWHVTPEAPFVVAIARAPGECKTCPGYRK